MIIRLKLGSKVRDMISGFSGIAASRAEYLNGCQRVLIEPDKVKDDGSVLEGCWFDISQVEIVTEETGLVKDSSGKANVGGPQKTPQGEQSAPKW